MTLRSGGGLPSLARRRTSGHFRSMIHVIERFCWVGKLAAWWWEKLGSESGSISARHADYAEEMRCWPTIESIAYGQISKLRIRSSLDQVRPRMVRLYGPIPRMTALARKNARSDRRFCRQHTRVAKRWHRRP